MQITQQAYAYANDSPINNTDPGRRGSPDLSAARTDLVRLRDWFFGVLAACATVSWGMTAKEELRVRVEALTEEEAVETLRLLDRRRDPLVSAFRDAPEDDEPWTEEDEAAAAEGRADLAAGRTVSLEDAMRDLG